MENEVKEGDDIYNKMILYVTVDGFRIEIKLGALLEGFHSLQSIGTDIEKTEDGMLVRFRESPDFEPKYPPFPQKKEPDPDLPSVMLLKRT